MIAIIGFETYLDYSAIAHPGSNAQTLTCTFPKAGGSGTHLTRFLRYLDTKAKLYTIIGQYTGYQFKTLCRAERIPMKYILSHIPTDQQFWVTPAPANPQVIRAVNENPSKKTKREFLKMMAADAHRFSHIVFADTVWDKVEPDYILELETTILAANPKTKLIYTLPSPDLIAQFATHPNSRLMITTEPLPVTPLTQNIAIDSTQGLTYQDPDIGTIASPFSSPTIPVHWLPYAVLAGVLFGIKRQLPISDALALGARMATQDLKAISVKKLITTHT